MEIRESAPLRQYYRKALIVSGAFGAALPTMAFTGEWLLSFDASASSGWGWLLVIAAFSLALLPAIALVRGRMLGEGAGLHAVVDQVMVPQNRYRRMLDAVTVSMVMCMLPALFGLGLVLAGGARGELYLAIGASAVLYIVYVPRYRQWQAWFSRRSGFR